jgi:outer membrane protein
LTAFALGLVASSTPAAAQAAPAASVPAMKIGVINWQGALLGTQELQKRVKELTAKYQPQADALDKAKRDLADIQTEVDSSQGKLSPQREAELQAQGTRKQREVERLTDDLQTAGETERQDLLQQVGTRMTTVVKKLMEDNGLDMIVDTASVVAFKPTVEITTAAIAAYDKAYPPK